MKSKFRHCEENPEGQSFWLTIASLFKDCPFGYDAAISVIPVVT